MVGYGLPAVERSVALEHLTFFLVHFRFSSENVCFHGIPFVWAGFIAVELKLVKDSLDCFGVTVAQM